MSTQTQTPTRARRVTLADLERTGKLDDFQPGHTPSHSALIRDTLPEREAAAEATCASCGHVGLGFRAFTRRDGSSWRAYAMCPHCQHAEGF